jgi:hypothetical protein
MESVNFHRHCDCMGQMHCLSNKCRNGAATACECHGQGQKLQSLNVKHFCHLHKWSSLAGHICIHEAVRVVVQHIKALCGALSLSILAITECTADRCKRTV